MEGGGACNIHFCFFPHTYSRLPILNVIAARRPLKLDILIALLLYNLVFVQHFISSDVSIAIQFQDG